MRLSDARIQVYSPFLRSWIPHLTDIPDPLACAADPQPNNASIRTHAIYGKLFNSQVPTYVDGFELAQDDTETMRVCWPAGEEAAEEMLSRFLRTKARASQMGAVDPLAVGAIEPKKPTADSRVGKYKDARDRVDSDTTSRLR